MSFFNGTDKLLLTDNQKYYLYYIPENYNYTLEAFFPTVSLPLKPLFKAITPSLLGCKGLGCSEGGYTTRKQEKT